MNLILKRKHFTAKSTIGELSLDGKFLCFILEDADRGLQSDMKPEVIESIKKYGITAIPYGTYEVKITMSNRFKVEMPLLLNTPGYAGVRIHPGNKPEDTEGCLLPGKEFANDMVLRSRVAYLEILELIKQSKEKVYLTITK